MSFWFHVIFKIIFGYCAIKKFCVWNKDISLMLPAFFHYKYYKAAFQNAML